MPKIPIRRTGKSQLRLSLAAYSYNRHLSLRGKKKPTMTLEDFIETPTAGYNNLKAEISYRWRAMKLTNENLSEVIVGVVGNNLLNDDIRNSVSYTKDEVPMPGRGVRVFANVRF